MRISGRLQFFKEIRRHFIKRGHLRKDLKKVEERAMCILREECSRP